MSTIPIENIYYLLCYAWDKLDEKDIVRVDPLAHNNVLDLLAHVLANGVSHLLKQGPDRGYVLYAEETATIRGKVCFTETLKRNYFQQPKLFCEFDELSHNVLHNQILKTTLDRLRRCPELNKSIHAKVMDQLRRWPGIDLIPLSKNDFRRVQLHANNRFYRFLLHVCELLFDCLLPSENEGEMRFVDFTRDDRKMAELFEQFVRNFYRLEQINFRVDRKDLSWDARVYDNTPLELLPMMKTDICLMSAAENVVIDTKFYRDALKRHYEKEILQSGHLFQLSVYLRHFQRRFPIAKKTKGVLLYPTVKYELILNYELEGYPVSIRTINLNQPWPEIHRDLLAIIAVDR